MSLSGGERRRLEIARSLVSNPKIILLDEPFTGIDPVTIDSIQEIIYRLRDDGIAILITDHQVRETLQVTDRAYVINSGQVLCHGTPDEVLQNPEARRLILAKTWTWATGAPQVPIFARRSACKPRWRPATPKPQYRQINKCRIVAFRSAKVACCFRGAKCDSYFRASPNLSARQPHSERAALVQGGAHFHGAGVGFDDRLRDRQAKPRVAGRAGAGFVAAVESLEDVREVLRGTSFDAVALPATGGDELGASFLRRFET